MTVVANLCSSGCTDVSLEALGQLRAPAALGRWYPIPHIKLIEEVCRALGKRGIGITKEIRLAVSHGGARCFGVADLTTKVTEGVHLSLGIRNSTDKSLAAGVLIGERVMVCSNLCFSGDLAVLRTHTKNILADLPKKLDEAVEKIPKFTRETEQRIERLKRCGLTKAQAHDLVIGGMDRIIIPARDVPDVLGKWRFSDVFTSRTCWSLYNAFTATLKPLFEKSPHLAALRSRGLQDLFSASQLKHRGIEVDN